MAASKDLTAPIRSKAAKLPDAVESTSCNQTSFKAGKAAFLYIGPGAKGVGFKAMFKLERSMGQAEKLAASDPDHYEVGKNGWVTVRFSGDAPLPKATWEKWLAESYGLATGGGAKAAVRPPAKKKAKARKR